MNPTPNDGAANPSLDPPEPAAAPADRSGAADPWPSSDPPPLPRRTPSTTSAVEPGKQPGRDPDGRPSDSFDGETLNRLLGALREI